MKTGIRKTELIGAIWIRMQVNYHLELAYRYNFFSKGCQRETSEFYVLDREWNANDGDRAEQRTGKVS